MSVNNQSIKRLVLISILAAIAYVLMFIAFPILPFVSFLKLDFSDLPILLGLFTLGPVAALEITVLKLFLYWLTTGFSVIQLVGLSSSLVVSAIFIGIYYFFRQDIQSKTFKQFIPVVITAIVLMIVMSILNYFVFLPLYIKLLGFDLGYSVSKLVLIGIAPFNLIKGLVEGIFFVLIFNRLKMKDL
ncbi:ECF transporter S component [Fructilactobacillus sp. Tb1]|uniref:ECF transporter S component n=1 Tax=Fructilactobacillus sp. Tb1 TaxID=3422304 RepID=UPI003D2E3D0B